MTHAHALGVMTQEHNLLAPFQNAAFRLTITSDLHLRVVRIGATAPSNPMPSQPASPSVPHQQRPSPTAVSRKTEALVAILADLPWQAWEAIVSNEPEWQHMAPMLPRYGFGPFAVLMVATGLNDYQLTGRAETAYWPPIRRRIEVHDVPHSPHALYQLLEPFYEGERFHPEDLPATALLAERPGSELVGDITTEHMRTFFHHLAAACPGHGTAARSQDC